jgi:hypothetical protein
MIVSVEQHHVRVQPVGTQHERSAVAELELWHLQFGPFAVNDHPVLAPVELEYLSRGEH